MLRIIGISTTIEYSIKSFWENTFGRVSNFFSSGMKNSEDELITNAFNDYVQFIYIEPWYKYQFTPWIGKLWSMNFFGKDFIRRMERRTFFTLEFLIKDIYAKILKFAAESTYDPANKNIFISLKSSNINSIKKIDSRIDIKLILSNETIISIPRWKDFSEIIPKILDSNLYIDNISGNQLISFSIKGKLPSPFLENNMDNLLFVSETFSNDNLHRYYFYCHLYQLNTFWKELKNYPVKFEHFYDY